MLPSFLLELQIIVKDILSGCHLTILPVCFVETTLQSNTIYIGVNQSTLAMELPFVKLPFVNYSSLHSQSAEAVIPAIHVLTFVTVPKPCRHQLYYSSVYEIIADKYYLHKSKCRQISSK